MLWLILIAALGIAAAICIYSFHTCFYSGKTNHLDPYGPIPGDQGRAMRAQIYQATRHMDDAAFEPVTIRSFDGTALYGRLYRFREGAPVEIMFHGYRSMALRDGGGAFALAQKMGVNLLVPDQRAHGNSGGNVISFGIRERKDCLCWAEYAQARFGAETPIILSGVSMGAATVIMASALPLPQNVCCIVADCPYSSPGEIIRKVCKDRKIPARAAYPFIRFSARVLGGFPLEQCDAITAAGQSRIPILLIHGEADGFVPCEMSRQIYAAGNGNIRLETFPDADHGMSYMVDPARYEAVVSDFLRSIPALKTAFPE